MSNVLSIASWQGSREEELRRTLTSPLATEIRGHWIDVTSRTRTGEAPGLNGTPLSLLLGLLLAPPLWGVLFVAIWLIAARLHS